MKINELTTAKLDQYTKAANADYDKAKEAGDSKRMYKRGLNLMKASGKKIDNDVKALQKARGVAEESLNEVTQGVEHSEWADNVKDHYHPAQVRIIKKRTEDGRHVGSHAMVNGKKVGQYNMNTGVGTFTATKKEGVAEATWINGVKQDDKELVWKQTSMSYEEACKKYGKENCKVQGKTNRGEDAVLVKVPRVAEEKAGWSIKGTPKPAPKAPTPHWRLNKDGTATDLNTGITYKRDGSVVKTEEGVAEGSLNEFAPGNDDDNGGEEDALFRFAQMWYSAPNVATQQKVEQALAKAGWEIGELESEEGGAYVMRVGDNEGDSYIGWSEEQLADISEGVAEGMFGIDSKTKGAIQNVVAKLSDIPNMWDHSAQTFTNLGKAELEKVLNFNPKYIDYALNLTADDFED